MVGQIEEAKLKTEEEEMPFPQAGTPPPPEESYVVKSKVERDMNIQEIEARNR